MFVVEKSASAETSFSLFRNLPHYITTRQKRSQQILRKSQIPHSLFISYETYVKFLYITQLNMHLQI